jgi:hemerythrin
MSIEWKDSYCVGDARIDRQHQDLFALANAMLVAADQAAMRLCAIRLYKHVREHFSYEEELMQRVGYPDYREHTAAHDDMLQGLNAISHSIGRNAIDPVAVTRFVSDWALDHIPKEDAKFASYVKSQHDS